MSAALASIWRHPIKALSREGLDRVRLTAGAGLPWDRHWAVTHEASKYGGGWAQKMNFLRGVTGPSLMAVTAELDEPAQRLVLRHPERPDLDFAPDDPAEAPRLIDWLGPLWPEDKPKPTGIVTAGRPMTDVPDPWVAINNLASQRAVAQRLDAPDLSIHRWRGNLWVEGLAPWEEFDLVGRQIRIGPAILEVRERITRCKATMANPEIRPPRPRYPGRTRQLGSPGFRRLCRGRRGRRHRGGRSGYGAMKTLPFPLAEAPDTEAHEAGRKLFAGGAEFLKGVVAMSGLPPADRVEVCFAGRSNVGKSSLINAVTGRNGLARASNTPGRTQEINFFTVGEAHYLVDLPGYGFANAPVDVVRKWQELLKQYLSGRQTLRRAFVLIDARHGVKPVDEEILRLLDSAAVTFQAVLTKADKVKAKEREEVLDQVRAALAKHPAAFPEIVMTSSQKGDGIDTLRSIIATLA